MAAFFSFSQRNPFTTNVQEGATDTGHQEPIDPWNLGVSTSTSTMDTIGQQSGSDDIRFSKKAPLTPEGLRPRKSIQRIRKDVLESNHYTRQSNFSYNLPPVGEANSRPAETLQGIYLNSSELPIQRPYSPFRRQTSQEILPSSLERIDGSPIRSGSSFYEQSIEESNNFYDEDLDINSSMEDTRSIFSRQSESHFRLRAKSPDLKRGSRPKTAVGAVLVAMAETSAEQKTTKLDKNQFNARGQSDRHEHGILPPRLWMEDKPFEDKHIMHEKINDDDIIRDYSNRVADSNYSRDDDNQSSLHASPSSLRRGVFPTSWADREQDFQKDSSFTRGILNDDPSSSRLEEKSIIGRSPYDFNPIINDDIRSNPKTEFMNAPRILSLVEDNNRLNISAISNSLHQKEVESINTSLADTIVDEEEEYKEIPRYYHALADDAPAHNIISDDAFIMKKVQNQRMDKENLLRSTFERFHDCLDLLKDVYSKNSIENSFFLGLGKTKNGNEFYSRLQTLLSELQEGASYATQRQALLFCLSVLQNTLSLSNNVADLHSKYSSSFPTNLSCPRWVPRPGFRSSLGLVEEPQSPQTIRGGDTSLFSLPSESAHADTPHTSNVSLATTITTIVSPERYRSSTYNRQHEVSYLTSSDQIEVDINVQGARKTIESLSRLLYRLEETCRGLKSKIRGKSMLIESIQKIYFELLNVSSADLRIIIELFDMEYSEPQSLTRTVSNDEDKIAARSLPPFRPIDQKDLKIYKEYVPQTRDTLHVNIVQSDKDDIDSDNRNQSIECDLRSPTTNDMMSLVSPHSEEENAAATNNGYTELKDDQHVDDLRRTIGSFDEGDVEDERDAPPSSDEREPDHTESFPATFARRVVAQRSRRSRFWKKRFNALKNRGRQVTAE